MPATLSPSSTLDPSNQQYQIGIAGHKPTVLTRIYDDNISVCIQTRTLSKAITAYARFMCDASHSNIELSLIVTPTSIAEQLSKSLPYHDSQFEFIKDICTVVDMYSCLFDQEKIGLRLITLTKAMCPRSFTQIIFYAV